MDAYCWTAVGVAVVFALALVGALARIYALRSEVELRRLRCRDAEAHINELKEKIHLLREVLVPQRLVDERLAGLAAEVARSKKSAAAKDNIDAEARLAFWQQRLHIARAAARGLGYRVKCTK
ncbi:hypothetical protein D6833_06420 [Candidatus Parcubacteria bacterium]|nr:MAG: hypothetical protein D6833_06420 [Candidatus Parcubacteria bacterium]